MNGKTVKSVTIYLYSCEVIKETKVVPQFPIWKDFLPSLPMPEPQVGLESRAAPRIMQQHQVNLLNGAVVEGANVLKSPLVIFCHHVDGHKPRAKSSTTTNSVDIVFPFGGKVIVVTKETCYPLMPLVQYEGRGQLQHVNEKRAQSIQKGLKYMCRQPKESKGNKHPLSPNNLRHARFYSKLLLSWRGAQAGPLERESLQISFYFIFFKAAIFVLCT